MMKPEGMTCMECGVHRQRDGFPSSMFAECWQCVWDAHQREQHPIPRSQRRRIRKEARRVIQAQLTDDARSTLDAIRQLRPADQNRQPE